jgi:hypothetical protein
MMAMAVRTEPTQSMEELPRLMVKASYNRRLIFSVVVDSGRMIKSYEI